MVHDCEGIINLVKSVVKLYLGDDEGWCDVQHGCAHPHEDAVFDESLLELDDGLGVGVLEPSLDELSVLADEVESTEESSNTALSEAVVLSKHALHALREDLLHLLGVSNDVLLDHVPYGLVTSDATHRVGLIGCAPAERVGPEKVLNIFAETGSREGQV